MDTTLRTTTWFKEKIETVEIFKEEDKLAALC